MTDKEIIKALEHCSNSEAEACHKCPINEECNGDVIYMIRLALDLINRQQEQLEAAIAGQETLQKALAEKDGEIERLTAEKEQLIKTFGECQAEATKALAEKDKEIKRLNNNIFESCGNFISAEDVVKVVRCSECKYFGKELKQGKHSCLNYQLPYCLENDYCGYGERKDDDK